MIYYVGDIHARVSEIEAIDKIACENGVTTIVQVGDFGALWFGTDNNRCEIAKYFWSRKEGPVWLTCGGNHDNWNAWEQLKLQQGNPDKVELAPGLFWVTRGSVVMIEGEKHLFLGGAESTDKVYRIENRTWWKNETPNAKEFERFSIAMDEEKPDVVVTHDAPVSVSLYREERAYNTTPNTLDRIFNLADHKPKRWYFGHHHVLDKWAIADTEFYCCGLHGDYLVDGKNLDSSLTDLPAQAITISQTERT